MQVLRIKSTIKSCCTEINWETSIVAIYGLEIKSSYLIRVEQNSILMES